MIAFDSQTDFELKDVPTLSNWIESVILQEGYQVGEILYVFCDDTYLHKINVEFLNHDTLTDIITFDYNLGKEVNSEMYISIDRVRENAEDLNIPFHIELHRVMIHGILHLCGYDDKTGEEEVLIRKREDEALALLDL